MKRTITAMLVLLGTLGCAPLDNEGGPRCEETPSLLTLEAQTSLGYSAADVVALAATPSPWEEVLTYREGDTTGLTLTLVAEQSARFVESAVVLPRGGGPTPAIAIECFDRIEVDATGTFTTDDGAFDEPLEVTLISAQATTTSFKVALDPFALGGDYDINVEIEALEIPESDVIDEVSLFLEVGFDETGSAGSVRGHVTTEEECFDDGSCTASAAEIVVGEWGAAEE